MPTFVCCSNDVVSTLSKNRNMKNRTNEDYQRSSSGVEVSVRLVHPPLLSFEDGPPTLFMCCLVGVLSRIGKRGSVVANWARNAQFKGKMPCYGQVSAPNGALSLKKI